MDTEAPGLKFAILQDFINSSAASADILESFRELIQGSCPGATINVFRPIEGEPFPELSSYDLVIFTGGKFNLLSTEKKPRWVEDTLHYIKTAAGQNYGPKLLGICWGHQAISYALGGTLKSRIAGPCIGVETISLNDEGTKFFSGIDSPWHKINIHKFHLRYVAACPANFVPLAENNEILVSSSRRILSFQGHPEMKESISRAFLAGDNGLYGNQSTAEAGSLVRDIHDSHDGPELFKMIMAWACTRDTAV